MNTKIHLHDFCMIFDLHVHTEISSCSNLTMNELLDQSVAIGLDGVCITDHQSMQAKDQISPGFQENGLFVVIGMEYSTQQGDFLIFGLEQEPSSGLNAEQLLGLVREKEAVAVAAHPFRKIRPTDIRLFSKGLCQMAEIINGRNSDAENREAINRLSAYNILKCGGSDAHSKEEVGMITMRFTVPINSNSDFVQALKNGCYDPHIYRRAN